MLRLLVGRELIGRFGFLGLVRAQVDPILDRTMFELLLDVVGGLADSLR